MWWQRRTAIFLSARLIEVARLASTSIDVNICKICNIQKVINFIHFISKIFYINPSKIVYIYTFAAITMHICTVTVTCVYHYFINFTFCAFFSLPSPHRLLPQIHPHKHTHTDKPIDRQISASDRDRCLWVDGVYACGFWFLWCWWVFILVVLVVEIGAYGG